MKCDTCNEACPMADMAHEAAKGRMYVTKEFVALQKKIESGQLVEVVRCKDCIWYGHEPCCPFARSGLIDIEGKLPYEDDFCSRGERRE